MLCRPHSLTNVLRRHRISRTVFARSVSAKVPRSRAAKIAAGGPPPPISPISTATAARPPARPRRTKKTLAELPVALIRDGARVPPLDPDWRKPRSPSVSLGPVLIPTEGGASSLPVRSDFPDTQLSTEIVENLIKFPHCILLTRVGSFYESYFDQAIEVARLLSIKLTTRSWGGKRVPMCGFPLAHFDRYLKRLVQVNRRFVAVCDEFKRRDGTFERRIIRVVTPGTLIDESFVNAFENNYLMSISGGSGHEVGLAWIDVTTGEFFTQSILEENLVDEIARIGPKEVVLHDRLREDPGSPIRQALTEESATVSYIACDDPLQAPSLSPQAMDYDAALSPTSSKFPAKLTTSESDAVALLTTFLRGSLLEHMPDAELLAPTHQTKDSRMQIDAHTIKALEIKEEMREGGVTGSLMSVVKRTVTSSGTRLLERWLCSPSTSVSLINSRQSLVALFHSLPHFRHDLIHLLKQTGDASRIVQKFFLGKGDTDDLLSIKDSILVWQKMRLCIDTEYRTRSPGSEDLWASLHVLMERMADLQSLVETIGAAVEERSKDAAAEQEGLEEDLEEDVESSAPQPDMAGKSWLIRPKSSPQLTSMHRKLKRLHAKRDEMEAVLREKTGASSLSLNTTAFQGWNVRIAKLKEVRNMEDPAEFDLIEISKSASTRTFFHAPWTALGTSIMETQAAIFNMEKEAFVKLRSEVKAQGSALRRNARIMDELDVALAFANLAEERNFVRPIIEDSNTYHVVNGRHPTVELGLIKNGRNFVPNSVNLHPDSRLHIITGPNMAGKSTLLRQTTIIAIIAQTGSFVPADYAKIGIVDKVFSRIGAKDDLYRDRSTFMVEMLETADILKKATERSLVIMDEVGRGTTVHDGIAIAFATANHLYNVNKCRTLFATHFHDIADMLGYDPNHSSKAAFPGVDFFCTDVDETEDGYFTYSHRMRPGVNRDSHGLKVARMAGIPESVLDVAAEAVQSLGRGSDASFLRNLGRDISPRHI